MLFGRLAKAVAVSERGLRLGRPSLLRHISHPPAQREGRGLGWEPSRGDAEWWLPGDKGWRGAGETRGGVMGWCPCRKGLVAGLSM